MIKKVEKVWGSEEWIVNNEMYCGKILNLKTGHRGSIHYHKNKHETFYLLDGQVLLECNGEKLILNPGDSKIIAQGDKHRFTPLVDSRIIEFSTFHDDADTYRDSQSEKVDVQKIKQELKDEGIL